MSKMAKRLPTQDDIIEDIIRSSFREDLTRPIIQFDRRTDQFTFDLSKDYSKSKLLSNRIGYKRLVENGLLHKIEDEDGHAKYEINPNRIVSTEFHADPKKGKFTKITFVYLNGIGQKESILSFDL